MKLATKEKVPINKRRSKISLFHLHGTMNDVSVSFLNKSRLHFQWNAQMRRRTSQLTTTCLTLPAGTFRSDVRVILRSTYIGWLLLWKIRFPVALALRYCVVEYLQRFFHFHCCFRFGGCKRRFKQWAAFSLFSLEKKRKEKNLNPIELVWRREKRWRV